jgi:hypothetical protein
MMTIKKQIMLMAAMATGMVLCSCEYKDLGESTSLGTVTLNFDTTKIEQVPTSMRAVFYPADAMTLSNMTKGYTIFDCPRHIWPRTCELPAGRYYITAWNNDTEHVLYENMGDKDLLYATTFKYAARGMYDKPSVIDSIYDGQTVLDYPDYMVHAANNGQPIDVFPEMNNEFTLFPDSMVVTVNFKLKDIKGLDWVKECRGSLNNVAGKRFITPDNLTEDSVAVMFDCMFDEKENCVYGSFYVFGLYPSNSTIVLSHKMVMYFWMNGGQVFLPIDVTDIINNADSTGDRVSIEITDLDINLKDYVSKKNTFDLDVEEWSDVEIDIGF